MTLVCVEPALCVWKLYSTCQNHNVCKNYTLRVESTLCVWKSHYVCINYTRACPNHTCECHIHKHTCQNYSRLCRNPILRVKTHSACGNHHLCVKITVVRVVIKFVPVKFTFHRNLHVGINLARVKITLVRVVITFEPVKFTLRL
jgi:hypothetical protein